MTAPTIEDRLAIYGPATCPACGNSLETIFTRFGNVRELVCRRHPGHPLYEEDDDDCR